MKEYKIGLIGAENSHANAFCRAFNMPNKFGGYLYPNAKVTSVYGDYQEAKDACKVVIEKFGVEKEVETLDELVNQTDAVVITCRDGVHHAKNAMPFIKAGKPCFIDKPFTSNVEEAVELVRVAKANGVALSGGSSLKFYNEIAQMRKLKEEYGKDFHGAYLKAPFSFENDYGGFWFYSAHLAEMCLGAFGWKPEAVTAVLKNKSVHAIVEYADFAVTLEFADDCPFTYCAVLTSKEKSDFINIELEYTYRSDTDTFAKALFNGEMDYSYEQLIAPVILLDAIKQSYQTGKRIEISYPEI